MLEQKDGMVSLNLEPGKYVYHVTEYQDRRGLIKRFLGMFLERFEAKKSSISVKEIQK